MSAIPTERYARCIRASKRVYWDIDDDVIRGRRFDMADKFLPDGLTLAERFTTLSAEEKRFVSQIQGRTYANVFGLVERFINAKVLELCGDYVLGDQVALEAMVRFSDEELKHQALFRRIDAMMGEVLPAGYHFDFVPDSVARAVLGKSSWAVLLLTLDIELFTQLHYRQSIDPDTQLSRLFKDVFLYHWKEESQHAILDELELMRVDAASPRKSGTGASTTLSTWLPLSTRFCESGRAPTPSTSRPIAAGPCRRTRRGRSKPAFSRRTAGNTSTRGPGIRILAGCCPG